METALQTSFRELLRQTASSDKDTEFGQRIVAAILAAGIVMSNELYASVPLALEKYQEILAQIKQVEFA